jgi:hypothetical protein
MPALLHHLRCLWIVGNGETQRPPEEGNPSYLGDHVLERLGAILLIHKEAG